MKRRDFIRLIALFGGAVTLSSYNAAAQSQKMTTIGVLVVGSPGSQRFWRLFQEDLRHLGYTEGKNISALTRGRRAVFPLWRWNWWSSKWT